MLVVFVLTFRMSNNSIQMNSSRNFCFALLLMRDESPLTLLAAAAPLLQGRRELGRVEDKLG